MARDPSYDLREDDSLVEATNVTEKNRFLLRPSEELNEIRGRYLMRPDPPGKAQRARRPPEVGGPRAGGQ